jgi:hypothetical protein
MSTPCPVFHLPQKPRMAFFLHKGEFITGNIPKPYILYMG